MSRQKNVTYLNMALFAIAVLLVIVLVRMYREAFPPEPAPGAMPPANIAEVAPQEYVPPPAAVRSGPPADLRDVYASHPRADTGADVVAGWARLKPEEKAKFNDGIDRQIEESRKALEANPDDKKARHQLFISETVKKLAADGFNYKLPQKQGSAEDR